MKYIVVLSKYVDIEAEQFFKLADLILLYF
jgi:hypothetical protein